MTTLDKITGMQRRITQLEGNIDALETELLLVKEENNDLLQQIDNLKKVLNQKTQGS